MAKRKKRWKSKGTAVARAKVQPLREMVTLPKRGRPKREGDVGPTPETLAKLRPDILDGLTKARLLTKEQAIAGREIIDAWECITNPVSAAHAEWSRVAGRNDVEGPRVERLQRVWRHWAAEMPARTHVRCFVVVEWIMGDRLCDSDPKGAAGVLKIALEWWLKAGQETSTMRTTRRRPAHAAQQSIDNFHAT